MNTIFAKVDILRVGYFLFQMKIADKEGKQLLEIKE